MQEASAEDDVHAKHSRQRREHDCKPWQCQDSSKPIYYLEPLILQPWGLCDDILDLPNESYTPGLAYSDPNFARLTILHVSAHSLSNMD